MDTEAAVKIDSSQWTERKYTCWVEGSLADVLPILAIVGSIESTRPPSTRRERCRVQLCAVIEGILLRASMNRSAESTPVMTAKVRGFVLGGYTASLAECVLLYERPCRSGRSTVSVFKSPWKAKSDRLCLSCTNQDHRRPPGLLLRKNLFM